MGSESYSILVSVLYKAMGPAIPACSPQPQCLSLKQSRMYSDASSPVRTAFRVRADHLNGRHGSGHELLFFSRG